MWKRTITCRFLIWVLVVQIFSYRTLLCHDTKNKIKHILDKKSGQLHLLQAEISLFVISIPSL